jgi:hypothetical protein
VLNGVGSLTVISAVPAFNGVNSVVVKKLPPVIVTGDELIVPTPVPDTSDSVTLIVAVVPPANAIVDT